ncbi:MAG: hypothetical protein ACPG4N_12595 [Gammaproteobacteria bacterium]
MPKLQQLNIGFDAAQDRLLLRVRSDDNQEVRLWLTRRYVRLLWGVIIDLLSEANPIPEEKPEVRKAVLAFQQSQALETTDFQTPYQEDVEERPLGEAPILVTEIRKRVLENGRYSLGLSPKKGRGIEIGCDTNMLHAILKFLGDAVAKADWNLDLKTLSEPSAQHAMGAATATKH